MNKVLTMIMTLIVVSLHRGVVAFDRWGGGGVTMAKGSRRKDLNIHTFRHSDRQTGSGHSSIRAFEMRC